MAATLVVPFSVRTLLSITTLLCRLSMLERLCITWHGWVSAAVYLPVPTARSAPLLHLSVAKLDRLYASVQIAGKSADHITHCWFCQQLPEGSYPKHHGTTTVHSWHADAKRTPPGSPVMSVETMTRRYFTQCKIIAPWSFEAAKDFADQHFDEANACDLDWVVYDDLTISDMPNR